MATPGQSASAHTQLIEAIRRIHAKQYASALPCLETAFEALAPAETLGELEFFMGLCLNKLRIRASEADEHMTTAQKLLGKERFNELTSAWEQPLTRLDRLLALCARSFPFPIM
jgi:hypothetical protein